MKEQDFKLADSNRVLVPTVELVLWDRTSISTKILSHDYRNGESFNQYY